MSISSIRDGNLFDSSAQTLCNTVNCVGIMGKGIALEFKCQYPAMYKDYKIRCERGLVKLGEPYVYQAPPLQIALDIDLEYSVATEHQILNFPTKRHWRSKSKIKDIELGLKFLVEHYQEWKINSLAMPPLGCGNGGLDWHDIRPLMYQYLSQMTIPIEIYSPAGTPEN